MKRILRFRSILMVPDETGKTKNVTFDAGSIRRHELGIDAVTLITSRAWIVYFFLALLLVVPACVIAYGAASMIFKYSLRGSWGTIIPAASVVFVLLWLILGFRGTLRRLKWDHVVGERGKDRWKVIDEHQWELFNRMLVLAEEARKKRPVKKINSKWLDVND